LCDCEYCGKMAFPFRNKFINQPKEIGYEVRNLTKIKTLVTLVKDYKSCNRVLNLTGFSTLPKAH
jgi:uncharacterized OB-fold protein